MCTTKSDLGLLADSHAGAVLTKSCTLAYRNGNPKPRYHETAIGSINSMGIPNLGYEVYAQTALEHHQKYPPKPYFVSVSGMSINENLEILAKFILPQPTRKTTGSLRFSSNRAHVRCRI